MKRHAFFLITSRLPLNYHGIYYTKTTLNQITGIYWPHKTAHYDKSSHMSPITFMILDNTVLKVGSTSTFDPTSCNLVDFNHYTQDVEYRIHN